MKTLRITAFVAAMGSLMLGASIASAAPGEPGTEPRCGGQRGEGKSKLSKEQRFKARDTNGDGFLTQAEVGEQRWERLKVADANKDNKLSFEELRKARDDGKLKPRRDGKGQGKSKRKA